MSNNNKRIRSALLCITAGMMFVAYHQDISSPINSLTQASRKLLGVSFDPSTVTVKGKHPFEEGTIGLVINTPKCGTGGLTETFIKSFSNNPYGSKCVGEDLQPKTANFNCGGDRRVLRTHDMESGIEAIQMIRQSTDQKCMIATATRDPRTWLPSVFMQRRAKKMCHATMTKQAFYAEYRKWLMEDAEKIRYFINIARPWLLDHFGSSMTQAMEESRRNGGYATFKREQTSGLFGQCELLFLEMEESNLWPEFLQKAWPGISFAKGKARTDTCPESAANYKSLPQGYIYTKEELAHVIADDVNAAEYFRVYGMWRDDDTSIVIQGQQ
mmetsp:Transcript_9834/g.13855  ORF Transcript_9834/g.13855 Transcript_9834/m.13855 type:complete len:328 (+) Transcript_9834:107-1090(+)